MRNIFVIALSAFLSTFISSGAFSQDQMTKLRLITEAAKEVCIPAPLNQSSTTTELNAEGKLALNSALKKLIDGGVSAAGKYTDSKSFGVLQKDLASSIKDGNDCRRDITKYFMDKLTEKTEKLDSAGQVRLADAQGKCQRGYIAEAKKVFSALKVSYPGNEEVTAIERWCSREAGRLQTVTVSLQNSPSIFFQGYPGQLFRAMLTLEIDESYCGLLSTLTHPVDSEECELTAGLHNFSMTSISVFNAQHQKVVSNLKCGGQTRISIDAERLGIIICFRPQNFLCKLMEIDEKFENYTDKDCPAA